MWKRQMYMRAVFSGTETARDDAAVFHEDEARETASSLGPMKVITGAIPSIAGLPSVSTDEIDEDPLDKPGRVGEEAGAALMSTPCLFIVGLSLMGKLHAGGERRAVLIEQIGGGSDGSWGSQAPTCSARAAGGEMKIPWRSR
jgi:hypothetical protein